jgi:hypothetical protein
VAARRCLFRDDGKLWQLRREPGKNNGLGIFVRVANGAVIGFVTRVTVRIIDLHHGHSGFESQLCENFCDRVAIERLRAGVQPMFERHFVYIFQSAAILARKPSVFKSKPQNPESQPR